MMLKVNFYLCDPEKNTECKKSSCLYKRNRKTGCDKTSNRNCAKLDENDEPIIVLVKQVESNGHTEFN